jgi:hypothetical protein
MNISSRKWSHTTKTSEPPGDRSPTIEKITQHIPGIITREQNESLLRPITIEEVDQALQDTPEGKALGLDNFTTYFFHFYCPMIREF